MLRRFLLLALVLAAAVPAAAQVQSFSTLIECTTNLESQFCGEPFLADVISGSRLLVRYEVPFEHCSSVRLHVSVDGRLAATTGFLGWVKATAPFNALPLDTGLVDVGPVVPGAHTITIEAEGQTSGCNLGAIVAWAGTVEIHTPPRIVAIDVKPGSDENPINLGARGSTPIAILGSSDWDVRKVDVLSLEIAGAKVLLKKNGQPQASYEDVNGDGRLDLVVHVETAALQLTPDDRVARMRGRTDDEAIEGEDRVRPF